MSRVTGFAALAILAIVSFGPSGATAQQIDPAAQQIQLPATRWTDADIRASRVASAAALPDKPQWNADPMNLIVVIESGDDHVSLVDGDRFERIHRFASRHALHGAPKFTPGGRFVYFGSRDGWITRYDLWNLQVVAEVRAGLSLRSFAISSDGRWIMAANDSPHSVVLLDAQLRLERVYPAATRDGNATSRVSAVYDAGLRTSFIVALRDIAELWEISYDPKAEDFYEGLVHDFRMGEGIPQRGFLNVRRTTLAEPLDDLFFDRPQAEAIGATRPKDGAAPVAQIVNLDVRRRIATLPIPGMPHPGSGAAFPWQGTTLLASPNLTDGAITVIDTKAWRLVRTIPTPGPGFFIRSHRQTPYAWADSALSASARDTLTIIDKATLEPVAQVREPGRTLAHVEFTRDGSHALASLSEIDGALIVYDARTFREITRLPMSKPTGKYNVGNRISQPGASSD